MRFLIRKIALGFACTLLWSSVAACGPAAQPAAPGGGEEAPKAADQQRTLTTLEDVGQRGGKLSMASAASIFGNPNDPHLVITSSGRIFSVPVTDGLVKRDVYDSDLKIIPQLAKSWDISTDGLKYTFKLQEGVKFHNVAPVNGREFTSEDAKYTLLRITADPSIVSEKNRPRFQRRVDFGSVKSIETPAKYTLVVNLNEPYAPFMDSLSHPGTVILPKEFVDKFPDGLVTEGMVGTGPYLPTEFKNQQLMSFKKNPDYWKKDSKGNQLPYLDEVSFVVFTDEQSRLASFRARQIDTAPSGISASSVDAIKRDIPNAKVLNTPSASVTNYRFNVKAPPFQDVRVRKAIHLAIERHQMLELLAEGRGFVSGAVTPLFKEQANTTDWLMSQPGYRKDKKQDIEEARRLLKEAGYGDGLTINVMHANATTNAGDWLSLFTDQLKPINVTVKGEIVDYAGVWVPRSTNGEFEVSNLGHVFNVDVDSLFSAHLHSKGGRNYGKFSDAKLDELIDKQRATINPEERKRLVREAEQHVLDTVPMAFLYQTASTYLVQPWVHNFTNGPVSGHDYASVETAWVEKH